MIRKDSVSGNMDILILKLLKIACGNNASRVV
jgi:hypothetical protein